MQNRSESTQTTDVQVEADVNERLTEAAGMRFPGRSFLPLLVGLSLLGGSGVWTVRDAAGFEKGKSLAPPAAESARSASAEQKPAEDQQEEKSIRKPVQWPKTYDPRTLKPIRLFMTREELHEMWGPPAKSQYSIVELDPEGATKKRDSYITGLGESRVTRKEYSAEEYAAAVKRYGEVFLKDIYFRKTATNHYKVMVSYRRYPWRDEPKAEVKMTRVKRVYFFPATEFPIIRTLSDLPEVSEVCGSHCWMNGYGRGELSKWASVTVYPRDPNDRERMTPRQMARWLGWFRDAWKEDDLRKSEFEKWAKSGDRVPVLFLTVQSQTLQKNATLQDMDWMQGKVSFITLSHDTPHSTLSEEMEARNLETETTLLGSYIPPAAE